MITPGNYRHYKGERAIVLGTALHSETKERLVVYETPDNTKSRLWVRPEKMFLETVEHEGKKVKRFTKVD